MAEDPILDIFTNLPPTGLTDGVKVVIYASLLTVVFAIFFTWLSTRGRKSASPGVTTSSTPVKLTNDQDKLILAQMELEAFKEKNEWLHNVRNSGEISNSGFLKLNKYFSSEIAMLRTRIDEYGGDEREFIVYEDDDEIAQPQASAPAPVKPQPAATQVVPSPPAVAEEEGEEELSDITRDLESRLSGSDEDFYRSKPAGSPRSLPGFDGGELTAAAEASSPSTPAPKPPGPSSDTPTPARPAPKASIPAPPGPSSGGSPTAIPSPQAPKAQTTPAPEKPSIPKPDAPSAQIPSPGSPPGGQSQKPAAANPFQSVNPMAKQAETPDDEEGKFAKSTSIAALRSDMLRELARLKKYIDEGEE